MGETFVRFLLFIYFLVEGVKLEIVNFTETHNLQDNLTYGNSSEFLSPSSKESHSHNQPFKKYGGIVIGTTAVLILIGLVYLLYVEWRSSDDKLLSRKDIKRFKRGFLDKDQVLQNERYEDGFANVEAIKQPYNKLLEIHKAKLKILPNQILGEGEFGCVFKALLKDDSEIEKEVALKTTKPDSGAIALKGLLSEIKILSYLGYHANIVPIIGAYTGELRKGAIYLVTELCHLGSLKNWLKNYQNGTQDNMDVFTVPFIDMVRWSVEIACGMEYLSWENLEFSSKSDVWGYGVTLWEIFSLGAEPYSPLIWTPEFTDTLENGLRLNGPRYATSQIFDIMSSCWNIEKDTRPSFKALRNSIRHVQTIAHDEAYTPHLLNLSKHVNEMMEEI